MHESMYWRRWAFLASAAFNVLLLFFALHTRRISYAAMSKPTQPPPVAVSVLFALIFWGAALLAAAADTAIGLGLLRARYHQMLHITLACSPVLTVPLGLAASLYSLRVGYGYLEPLCLLLIAVLQAAIILSAYKNDAPEPLEILRPLQRRARQFQRALQAFWHALHLQETTEETEA